MVEKRPSDSHERANVVRAVLMAVITVVFVGYAMIWIVMPTNTYRQKWLPKIRANTNSTYFGLQGANILIRTFPILFVAVLGSVYLHLGKKFIENHIESESKRRRGASWRRPLIIKGLGIVSCIELSFFVMFIALLVWCCTCFLHFFFANVAKFPLIGSHKPWEAKLERVSLTLGIVGNISLTFLFFPVTRGSSVLPLFGLTSEGSIKYHIWLGHISMALFTAHGVLYIIYLAFTHQLSKTLEWANAQISNVAGELSLLFGLILWATTVPGIRRKMFELFFYTHYFYVLFIIFFVFHVGFSYTCIMLPGLYLFLIDRYLRFLQSRQRVCLVSARVLPSEAVEFNFKKSQGLMYTPTSIIFINVPSISKLQWHPFTISSSSNLEPLMLSAIVKAEGNWSKKLCQMLSSPASVDYIEMSIEGPYGPASTHFLSHDMLVMVSGGSGISPFISIIRELAFLGSTTNCRTPKLLLISAFKHSTHLAMLELLLPVSGTHLESTNLELQIEAFVTREKGPPAQNPEPVRTIWFKPTEDAAPISPVLGQNGWLWLGAVISSSFILFLLLMAIIIRYYIYSIDRNTDKIYSYSARAVLNMLLICISISITASAAFFWNKKQNSMESKLMRIVEDREGSTAEAERELESLPHQSLIKSTNVHYGGRPDLRRILLDCQGSSVGVLVCGPKEMRHSVAAICSSGLTKSLHFESISFSW